MATPPSSPALPRLATFASHLLLDGHGPSHKSSHERRDIHPYFGTWPYNVGDQFVALAISRLLRFEDFYTIEPGASAKDFETINQECDVFVIRGSNFIYPGFFEKCLGLQLLRKIKIPIVYIGAGIQYRLGEKPHLLPGDIESLKYIHGSSGSCSVRGFRAAELLNKAGISNVRPIGCPTILYSLQPSIKVAKASWENVGWTITDMTHEPAQKVQQFAMMEAILARSGRFAVLAQGGEIVLQEHILCRDGVVVDKRMDEQLTPHLLRSRRQVKSLESLEKNVRYYYRDAASPVVESLLKNAFFSNHVYDYLHLTSSLTFIAGTRLHGNTMALCQGVPALFVIHDERLRDMAELMAVPMAEIGDNLSDLELESLSWGSFESAYSRIYQETIDFLTENGLAHNLTGNPTVPPSENAHSPETTAV